VYEVRVELTVNETDVSLSVPANMTLLELLRERLELTGAKPGCEQGDCGSCVVLIDGMPVNSCLVLAAQASGHEIRTVEGLEGEDALHPLQQAFVDEWALQCGYCTPGVLMSAVALLESNPEPSDDEIKEAISGNLCRCTGYQSVVRAIRKAADRS
jgi:aerobic-type carbon monoxide dehydrogenase small subunit (CoxS/CutS family)